MMVYLRSTNQMKLKLRIDLMNVVKWWLDATFANHKDAKGQTGDTMSMGRGFIVIMSKNQKTNT